MEADWNERPQRTKRGLKEHRPFVVALLLASALGGALHATGFFESPRQAVAQSYVTKPFPATPAIPPAAGIQPAVQAQPALQNQPQSRAEIRWAHEDYDEQVNRLLTQSAETGNTEPVRQNVFNDANYVPAGSVNTVSMASPRQAPAAQPQTEARRNYVTVVTETKPDCFVLKSGSIECRRYKKAIKSSLNQSCYNSAHNYTEACRRAALYNPVQ